jgi:hypothetical protein
VNEALSKGEILRTHVLRPTWHFVAPENIRWMLALSAERIKSSARSRDRDLGIIEALYDTTNQLIRKILEGRQLTREILGKELKKAGITVDSSRMTHFLMRAEVEGIVCSGATVGKEQTYALLDDRVPAYKSVSKDEALEKLCRIYFTSHSPDTIADFAWWSGLSMNEARQGMEAIKTEFTKMEICDSTYYFSDNIPDENAQTMQSTYLLPAFDEYIISYRNRSAALSTENNSKAVSSNGIFRPTIIADGKVVGLWKKTQVKSNPVALDFFETPKLSKQNIQQAIEAFSLFYRKNNIGIY